MNKLMEKELTLDSREVAEMVGKRHGDLLRDIRTYSKYLNESNIALVDFFKENIYLDSKGEKRPNYQITKKGCEFIAHKLTGQKGAIFTATYINRFHELEKEVGQATIPNNLSPELQVLINMELKQAELETAITTTKEEVNTLKDTLMIRDENWRSWVNSRIRKIGATQGNFRLAYEESYNELESRARCDLNRRISNKRGRMFKAGASNSSMKKVGSLDIIEEDKQLKEIYTSIIKEMCIKYL